MGLKLGAKLSCQLSTSAQDGSECSAVTSELPYFIPLPLGDETKRALAVRTAPDIHCFLPEWWQYKGSVKEKSRQI
jgi:hypothetical protein